MKKCLIAFAQLIPVIISALLTGAHFLRAGNHIFVIVCFVLPFGLFIRHPLSARVVQIALLLATMEWIRTTFSLIAARSEMGLSWTRLAFILGTVACFTFLSALVFFTRTLRERYKLMKLPLEKFP